MLEYVNFCLICTLFALISYLYIRMKRYLPILKMAEDIFSSPQSDTNSSNTFSPEIASCIWVRPTQKNSSKHLVKKKWKNFLIIMKLSSQARW